MTQNGEFRGTTKEAIIDLKSDVKDLKEERLTGIKDSRVMVISREEKRVIITLDKDFASYQLKNHHGVILLRYNNKHSYFLTEHFSHFLDSSLIKELENALCEIFDTYVKIRKE